MTVPTYDQGRKEAPWRVCAACGKRFACMVPLACCLTCDRVAAIAACRPSEPGTVRKSA